MDDVKIIENVVNGMMESDKLKALGPDGSDTIFTLP